jgi:type IV pilus assembly protein PilW
MRNARGFTIIEFMIAMTLSLLVLAALTGAFVASSRSRAEIERANEQVENGRFALQILTDDLETAGFLSKLNVDLAMTADTNKMTAPATKPNPCATTLAALRAALPMHIQGYDDLAALDSDLDDCLTDHKAGTDIVAIRRTAVCALGEANCAPVPNAAYFQASRCATELGTLDANNYYKLDSNLGNLNRKQRDCATNAEQRQYLVHIYFIANSDVACTTAAACSAAGVVGKNCDADAALDGDCIPTLKRAELGANLAFTIVPLAHGIEDLQFQYGIDNGPVGAPDGAPDAFTSSPDTYGTGGPYDECSDHNAQCIDNWRNVTALRISLLARNTTTTQDHVDSKVYIVGQNDDGTPRCEVDSDNDGTCEAFGDGYKRHVYETSVRLNNAAGRRES